MKRKPWKILVVDDNISDAVKIVHMLHWVGDQTTLCLDGADALLEAENDQFDLVVLDWNMPSISGQDFLRQIPWDRGSEDQPLRIVIHTAENASNIHLPKGSERFYILDIWEKSLSLSEILKKLNHLKEVA